MTHEVYVDDGDLEIEAWEQADAQLAKQGMTVYERQEFWAQFKTEEQLTAEELMRSVQLEMGCEEEQAWRIIRQLAGQEML